MDKHPQNLSNAIFYAIAQNWWVIILVVVIPIGYAVLIRKFEKLSEVKIKNLKKK